MRVLLAIVLLLAPVPVLALDLAASAGFASLRTSDKPPGLAADLRLGGTSQAGEMEVTSEVGALFASMGDAQAYGLLAGWRLRFGKLVRPGALIHLGLGHYKGEGLEGFTDALWQVGGLLDVVPVKQMWAGVHVEYTGFFAGARQVVQQCSPSDPRCSTASGTSPTWLTVGLHAAVRL